MRTLLVVSLWASACGGEPTAEPAPQAPASKAQEIQAVVASEAAPASVAEDPAVRLVGAWKPDIADVATDPDVLRLPKAAQAEAIQAASRILEGVGFDFGADGTVTLRDGDVTRSGRYTVEQRGAELVVRVSLAREEESPREEELTVRFEGAAMRVTAGEGKSRRFVRR